MTVRKESDGFMLSAFAPMAAGTNLSNRKKGHPLDTDERRIEYEHGIASEDNVSSDIRMSEDIK